MAHLSLANFRYLQTADWQNFPQGNAARKPLRGVSIDSRTIQPGQVYWVLRGENFDGHSFITESVNKGAAAVVIEKTRMAEYSGLSIPLIAVDHPLAALQELASRHRKKFTIPVLGLTGTNGKTTTKEMVSWILQQKFSVHKTHGNLNNHIGVPLTLLQLNADHELAIIEMGTNHPGEIAALCQIAKPNQALITNIGRGHLQYFASVEGVAREKSQLFESLSSRGIIYLNLDDKRLPSYSLRRKTVQPFSMTGVKGAKVTGKIIDTDDHGRVIWQLNGKTRIRMNVPGAHNAQNALASAAVALHFGFRETEIRDALESYTAYDKRMQIIETGGMLIINDCYNANPDSFKPALDALAHISERQNRRRIIVVGDMKELGLESDAIHLELMFELLDYNPDGIFTIGRASGLAAEELRAKGFDKIYSFKEHDELAVALKKFVREGDAILLKASRGMQLERVLAGL
jgi:UDP-N-acetylmuramoyl-tripeptide--D-alanyl-D-alanine ligase